MTHFLVTTDFTVPLVLILLAATIGFVVWAIRTHQHTAPVPRAIDRTPVDNGLPLSGADDWLHPTGLPGARVALAREGIVLPSNPTPERTGHR